MVNINNRMRRVGGGEEREGGVTHHHPLAQHYCILSKYTSVLWCASAERDRLSYGIYAQVGRFRFLHPEILLRFRFLHGFLLSSFTLLNYG
jgi:hypothetical protein